MKQGSQERTPGHGLELEALVCTQNCVCVVYGYICMDISQLCPLKRAKKQ